jgi:hypothetical protein
MRFTRIGTIGFLLTLTIVGSLTAAPSAQMYAPVVGRWRIELSMEGKTQSLEFETDDQGRFGFGTGYIVLYNEDSSSREYPAAWSNRNPQKISITGEIMPDGREPVTLLLRTTLNPGEEIKGDATIIDPAQRMRKGSFTMKRLLGPEQIKRKTK